MQNRTQLLLLLAAFAILLSISAMFAQKGQGSNNTYSARACGVSVHDSGDDAEISSGRPDTVTVRYYDEGVEKKRKVPPEGAYHLPKAAEYVIYADGKPRGTIVTQWTNDQN
jgi:hypothetical protein